MGQSALKVPITQISVYNTSYHTLYIGMVCSPYVFVDAEQDLKTGAELVILICLLQPIEYIHPRNISYTRQSHIDVAFPLYVFEYGL